MIKPRFLINFNRRRGFSKARIHRTQDNPKSPTSSRIGRTPCQYSSQYYENDARTVFRLPSGLQRAAPTNTPGSAILANRSCHSAVFLISAALMTLDRIVAEKTPLGNVTCRGDNQFRFSGRICRYAIETNKVIQKPDILSSSYITGNQRYRLAMPHKCLSELSSSV